MSEYESVNALPMKCTFGQGYTDDFARDVTRKWKEVRGVLSAHNERFFTCQYGTFLFNIVLDNCFFLISAFFTGIFRATQFFFALIYS